MAYVASFTILPEEDETAGAWTGSVTGQSTVVGRGWFSKKGMADLLAWRVAKNIQRALVREIERRLDEGIQRGG